MEAITALLDTIRVRSTAYFSKAVSPPWGMAITERSGFWRFHLVLDGATWISLPGSSSSIRLTTGDFVIIPFGHAHVLSDRESGPAETSHHIPSPEEQPVLLGHSSSAGETRLLCGYFRFAEGVPPPFLAHLPGLLTVHRDAPEAPPYLRDLFTIIQSEMQPSEPASTVVLNRLTEVLFHYALRLWIASEMAPEGILAGLADPRLQRALAAIHEEPSEPWTVESLARLAGSSRAAFAKNFRQATGYTPIGYLTHRRTEIARQLLADSDLSIEAVASRAGYADASSFNRAFRRSVGASPSAFRKDACGEAWRAERCTARDEMCGVRYPCQARV